MHFLPEPIAVDFTEDTMSVALDDGRTITVPIAWYPRLMHGTDAQRAAFELSPGGVHWDELDEDISVEGMLGGFGDTTRLPLRAA